MIELFEEQTKPLDEYERVTLLPLMVRSLKRHVGKAQIITNAKMREGFANKGHDVGGARIRKLISHIRLNGLVECLMATGRGYYVTNSVKELEKYIQSLRKRVEAIQAVISALIVQLEKLRQKQQTDDS